VAFTLLPAIGRDFIGRKSEVDRLVSLILKPTDLLYEEKKGIALLGKRNVGKTSVLKKIINLVEKEGIFCLYVSLDDLTDNSQQNFVKRVVILILNTYKSKLGFEFNVEDLFNTPMGMLDSLLKNLKRGLSEELIINLKLLLTFDREKKVDMNSVFIAMFSLFDMLAKETKTKLLLVIDEFCGLRNLKDGVDSNLLFEKFKSAVLKYENTLLLVADSNKPACEELLLRQGSIFEGFFHVEDISSFSKEHIQKTLEKNSGKKIPENALELILDFTGGIPFYVQFIGRMLGRHGFVSANSFDQKIVSEVIQDFLEQEANILFREQMNRLSNKEKLILVCMIEQDLNTPSSISKEINYSQTNVRRFLSIMEEKELVVNTKRGVFEIQDNVFKLWVKNLINKEVKN
jgi:uncharacterized protein